MFSLAHITRNLLLAALVAAPGLSLAQVPPKKLPTYDCLRGNSRSAHCEQLLRNYWQHEPAIRAIAVHYGLEHLLQTVCPPCEGVIYRLRQRHIA